MKCLAVLMAVLMMMTACATAPTMPTRNPDGDSLSWRLDSLEWAVKQQEQRQNDNAWVIGFIVFAVSVGMWPIVTLSR